MLGNLEAQEQRRLPWAATRRRLPHLSVQRVYQELELPHPKKRRSNGQQLEISIFYVNLNAPIPNL